jgi:hypothetical protein
LKNLIESLEIAKEKAQLKAEKDKQELSQED